MLGKFGEFVKEKRLQLGLTREELADLANTTATVIYRVEIGKENAGKDLSDRIQEALGVNINNGLVEESIDKSIDSLKFANGEMDAYREFKAIIRALYSMNQKDIHKIYEFVCTITNEKRKR